VAVTVAVTVTVGLSAIAMTGSPGLTPRPTVQSGLSCFLSLLVGRGLRGGDVGRTSSALFCSARTNELWPEYASSRSAGSELQALF